MTNQHINNVFPHPVVHARAAQSTHSSAADRRCRCAAAAAPAGRARRFLPARAAAAHRGPNPSRCAGGLKERASCASSYSTNADAGDRAAGARRCVRPPRGSRSARTRARRRQGSSSSSSSSNAGGASPATRRCGWPLTGRHRCRHGRRPARAPRAAEGHPPRGGAPSRRRCAEGASLARALRDWRQGCWLIVVRSSWAVGL